MKKTCFTNPGDYFRRVLLFALGQSWSAAASALMVALNMGADAYNILVQGCANTLGIAHGTMSSIMLFSLLLLCIPYARGRIGLGTVASIFLVGGVVNFFLGVFAPVVNAPLPVRIVCMFLIPLVIGSGIALVQIADVGMASNDLLPLILFEKQHRLQYRTVRILYDAFQCVIGLILGGKLGVCSVISVALTGPVLQATLRLLHKLGLHDRQA